MDTRYSELVKKVIEFIGQKSKVLDVGCGIGNVMEMLRGQKQCECTGIDISEIAIDLTREKGFEAYAIALPDLPIEISDMKYDFITLTEVLEHLTRPAKTLNALKGHLNRYTLSFNPRRLASATISSSRGLRRISKHGSFGICTDSGHRGFWNSSSDSSEKSDLRRLALIV